MSLFHKKNDKSAKPPAQTAPACPSAVVRVCPTCHCPVESPYSLTCPRCRTELPALPDCGSCQQHCHLNKPNP